MIRKSGTGFPKRSCSNKRIERDDDSKKSHHALERRRFGMGWKSPQTEQSIVWLYRRLVLSRPWASGHHTARQVISILIADYAMIRIAAIVAGLMLIACPAVWLAGITIPVPMYRTHGF